MFAVFDRQRQSGIDTKTKKEKVRDDETLPLHCPNST